MNKNRELAEAYVSDAQRATENAADKLIRLAEDLKVYASSFPDTLDKDARGTPASRAADIVSRFTNNIGNVDLWSVVRNAGVAERYLVLAEVDEADSNE